MICYFLFFEAISHKSTICNSLFIRFCNEFILELDKIIAVSSAYNVELHSEKRRKLLTYKKSSDGRRQDPCGAPIFIFSC